MWIEPDIREQIVFHAETMAQRFLCSRRWIMRALGLCPSRYYDWAKRQAAVVSPHGSSPKSHWLLTEERETILCYCRTRLEDSYRGITYMMLDDNVVAVSLATTYRVLHEAALLNRSQRRARSRQKGFV